MENAGRASGNSQSGHLLFLLNHDFGTWYAFNLQERKKKPTFVPRRFGPSYNPAHQTEHFLWLYLAYPSVKEPLIEEGNNLEGYSVYVIQANQPDSSWLDYTGSYSSRPPISVSCNSSHTGLSRG